MFARLMEEYGSQEDKREEVDAGKQESKFGVPGEFKKGTQKLMQDEERITGAVSWSVYSKYFSFAGSWSVPLLFLFVSLSQVAQGMSSRPLIVHSTLSSPNTYSCKHTLPRLLDVLKHPRVLSRRLHGHLCCARCG